MSDRKIIAAVALLAWSSVEGAARAAETADGERLVVELALTDSLPAEQAAALRGLLESQLPPHGLSLRLESGITSIRPWLARDSQDALLRVALDAPAVGGWRLVLVDAPRGRAVARKLTGGVRRDRAAVEAVCDIVVSAAVALREGLEVASQTVDEALTGAAPNSSPAASPARDAPATLARPAPSAGPAPAPFDLRVEAGAGPAFATFARAAPTSWGAAAAISVWHERVGLELAAARYLGQTVTATEGSFAIDRTQVGVSAAAAAGWGRARLTGGLGVLLEILQRGGTSPAAGRVATAAGGALTRLGPEATAALDVAVSRRVALTWALGLGYFPRQVRYLSSAGTGQPLAEPWPLAALGTLRVNVTLP